MGRWRDSWAVRNLSVRLVWPMPQTRLPLWFRATGSSALMEVLPDMAAASAGSAGCSLTRGSLWRRLRPDAFQKRHESLKQRRCSANELAETPRRHGDPPMARQATEKAEAFQKMNRKGDLLLPNAWDAASARIFEEAGFAAIGTTHAYPNRISMQQTCRTLKKPSGETR